MWLPFSVFMIATPKSWLKSELPVHLVIAERYAADQVP